MSETNPPGGARGAPDGGLNASHVRVIFSALAHVDHLLRQAEDALEERRGVLYGIAADLDPERRDILRDYLEHAREALPAVLDAFAITPPATRTTASWAVRTALVAASIAIEEVAPERLAGYGAVGPSASERWGSWLTELGTLLDQAARAVAQPERADLCQRVAGLPIAPERIARIAALERVVSAGGLTALRAPFESALERLEARRIEIAVFGRVSVGKSSLLNAILAEGGEPAWLPVGATPVTGVVVRIVFGDARSLRVVYADGRGEVHATDALADFVSERGNPRNRRGVAWVELTLPAGALGSNLVLVDTPGVGSVAAHGERAAKRYLPRADLGLVLVDAMVGATPDDIDLLERLARSHIEAEVLLAKADLLTAADLESAREQLAEALATRLDPCPPITVVSAVPARRAALSEWIRTRLSPRTQHVRQRLDASAYRRLEAIRQRAIALLGAEGAVNIDTRTSGVELGTVLLALHRAEHRFQGELQAILGLRVEGRERWIGEAAKRLAAAPAAGGGGPRSAAIREALDEAVKTASRRLRVDVEGRLTMLIGAFERVLAPLGAFAPTLTADLLGAPEPPACLEPGDAGPGGGPVFPSLAVWRERRWRRWLLRHYGAGVEEAVGHYARVEGSWARGQAAELSEQAHAAVDAARAGQPPRTSDAETLARDLALLADPFAGPAPPGELSPPPEKLERKKSGDGRRVRGAE